MAGILDVIAGDRRSGVFIELVSSLLLSVCDIITLDNLKN